MNDRVALITGSGRRRLGWHIAEALVSRGYMVALQYRTSQAEAEEAVAQFEAAPHSGCGHIR